MRATLSVVTLLLTFLVGCTDQSQLAGPTSTSHHSTEVLAKPSSVFAVDTKVIGPGGLKYVIAGTIDYAFKTEGETITLVTNLTLKIAQSGSDQEQKVSGGKTFNVSRGPGKADFVSESYAMGSVAESSHRVWIQYSIADNVVDLNDLKIVSGDPD